MRRASGQASFLSRAKASSIRLATCGSAAKLIGSFGASLSAFAAGSAFLPVLRGCAANSERNAVNSPMDNTITPNAAGRVMRVPPEVIAPETVWIRCGDCRTLPDATPEPVLLLIFLVLLLLFLILILLLLVLFRGFAWRFCLLPFLAVWTKLKAMLWPREILAAFSRALDVTPLEGFTKGDVIRAMLDQTARRAVWRAQFDAEKMARALRGPYTPLGSVFGEMLGGKVEKLTLHGSEWSEAVDALHDYMEKNALEIIKEFRREAEPYDDMTTVH